MLDKILRENVGEHPNDAGRGNNFFMELKKGQKYLQICIS